MFKLKSNNNKIYVVMTRLKSCKSLDKPVFVLIWNHTREKYKSANNGR